MSLALLYSALSRFCRKVRLAMEHKGLSFAVRDGDNVHALPVPSPVARCRSWSMAIW